VPDTNLKIERELYLDLSQFDWEYAALNAFIARMHGLPIRLQDVLLHVHLPELVARGSYDAAPNDPSKVNITSHHEESQQSRKEVKDILDWLREKFEVNSIIELVVKDNLNDPHWEEIVEECLSPFSKIEHLNWRKIDLSMRSINAARSLRELWLYSSGNWNSIAQWLGVEGLVSLPEASRNFIALLGVRLTDFNGSFEKSISFSSRRVRSGQVSSTWLTLHRD
jgi:hypothetical protein